MSGEPVLVVDGLQVEFDSPRGTVHAVAGVSFELDAGSTLGIVGESGSGKSVMCRAIMGLLPGRHVHRQGRVVLAGREVSGLTGGELRELLGPVVAMVPQHPRTSLNPVLTVGSQITESLRLHLRLSSREATEEAVQLLAAVGIPEPGRRFKQYPHELSGGMCQRVTIAMALSCRPQILIADEPTTALDVTVQAQILDLLKQLQVEHQMALVLVTHDLSIAAACTDRIAVMYAGRFVEEAPTGRLFDSMRMPYTEALLAAIPDIDRPSHSRLRAIEGQPPDLAGKMPGCAFAPRCPHVRERCREEEPPLVGEGGHRFACWYPLAVDAQARVSAHGR